jgi:hypothetical protein
MPDPPTAVHRHQAEWTTAGPCRTAACTGVHRPGDSARLFAAHDPAANPTLRFTGLDPQIAVQARTTEANLSASDHTLPAILGYPDHRSSAKSAAPRGRQGVEG